MARAKKSKAKPVAKKKPAAKKRVAKKQPVPKQRAAKKPAANKSTAPSIDTTLATIETFFTKLRAKKTPLELYPADVKPSSAAAIEALDKTFSTKLPDDVKRFLARGFAGLKGSCGGDDDFTGVGFDFLDAEGVATTTAEMRDLAAEFPDDDQQQVALTGIALTYEEPQLVLAANGELHHWSGRNDRSVVASSFSAFLDNWAAAGCHSSHSFDALWPLVKDLAPKTVPLAKNSWLKAYKKQFPESVKMKFGGAQAGGE